MSEFGLILGMMAVTFLPRYLPMVLAGNIQLPKLLQRALNYIPVAVLTVIIGQNAVVRDGAISISMNNYYLIATVVAIFVAWRFGHLLLTVVSGLLAYGALQIIF